MPITTIVKSYIQRRRIAESVKTMEQIYETELVVKGEIWDTLWLIQKSITEGQKTDAPYRIEITRGSVETAISMAANIAAIGTAVYKIIEYIRKKRKEDKSLKITKFNRDVVRVYVLHHLKTVAKVAKAQLTSEHLTDGEYHFEFKETKTGLDGTYTFRHIYVVSKDFDVRYDRREVQENRLSR